MNEKELKILASLRENSRTTITQMSKKSNIPTSTIFDRIKETEKKFIVKHTSILDFSRMGYNARAIISLKSKNSKRKELEDFLSKSSSVNTILRTNNKYDYIIEAVFKKIEELETFYEKIGSKFEIEKKEISHIINDIKKEGFLSKT